MLIKLTAVGTDLLYERMNGGNGYVQADDDGMLKLIRDATKTNEIFASTVKEIAINQVELMSVKFNGEYDQEDETIHVIELETKMAIIVNPTRSAIVDDYMIDSDAVKDKLNKMGYNSSLLVKRNERSKAHRTSKKARFKPRKIIGQSTKGRYKKECTWAPDIIRRNREGRCVLPAVIIK